ncbi:hypothetical protein VHUM_03688 [Vanrija humicola]|uniref:Outer spore wall protein RRT8 n=1 Tax=Vanrija humicola TaxID=5417 RepID=A0A7D8Z0L6_VANHU|nr:hypothetical protein VHUM_03688 [Vanrija humicola]
MSDLEPSTTRQRANAASTSDGPSSSRVSPESTAAAPHTPHGGGDDHRIRAAVSDSAKRQVTSYTGIVRDAVASGAWAYPLYGALYILSHPRLLVPVLPVLLRALLISAGVVAAAFFFLYLPQVAWLALFSGPLAFAAAIPLVLAEAWIVLVFLGKNFLLGQLNTDLFDAVLVQRGYSALVEKGRAVTTKKGSNVRVLGRALTKPLSKFSTDGLVRYLITLPLNFIPVVGTAFFLGYNGYKSGPGYHARYFQLKGFDKEERDAFIKQRRGAYAGFGTIAIAFNLVPIVSVLLSLTTSAGAALWAADLESSSKAVSERSHTYPVELPVALPAGST